MLSYALCPRRSPLCPPCQCRVQKPFLVEVVEEAEAHLLEGWLVIVFPEIARPTIERAANCSPIRAAASRYCCTLIT